MTTAKPKAAKPEKEKNLLVLGAEVYRTGMHPALGRIVKVTKTLVKVEWDSGSTEHYGRRGQSFHGRISEQGEAIVYTLSGKPIENVWGSEEDTSIAIATDGARQRIAEERAKKESAKEERARKQAEIEADPAFQKRQTDFEAVLGCPLGSCAGRKFLGRPNELEN
jgi:hypothetical protein